LHQPGRPFAHGYLSVDLFFVLSGFVLAFAFGDKLGEDLSPARFILLRIRRLAPVLVLGSVAAAIGAAVADHFGGAGQLTVSALLVEALRNAFLIPRMGAGGMDAFAINPPTWSLFAEFWTNVVFAFVAPYLDRRRLIFVVALGWLFIIIHAFVNGSSDFGSSTSTIIVAIPRAMASFSCGVLIFRLRQDGMLARLPSINPLFLFGAWIAATLMPAVSYSAPFDVLQIVVILPLMIALLARYEGKTPRWAIWLGKISYPLYATHAAIVNCAQHIAMAHGGISLALELALFIPSIGFAWVAAQWYEPAIAGFFRRRPPAPAGA
jgi:peptidoglycan/LPS O-acetylase OafA/YrhL